MATLISKPFTGTKWRGYGTKINPSHWVDQIRLCMERRRQRRQLLRLDAHMLKDIGISRADAVTEAAKPCWRR